MAQQLLLLFAWKWQVVATIQAAIKFGCQILKWGMVMKRRSISALAIVIAVAIISVGLPSLSIAQEQLKYSCSNQVFKSLDKEKADAFSKATGIKVRIFTSSSRSATYRLMSGYSDIASTARAIDEGGQNRGYTQIPICKDPLSVVANAACGIENLTVKQLVEIFSGKASNWKDVGGADLPITVIVPSRDSAANINFQRQVMQHNEIEYDFMAYDSTMVIEAVKFFPCGAVAFVSQGAAIHHTLIRTIKIDGKMPTDPSYPYYQTFYYVTKGEPTGLIKQFIDFSFSDTGEQLIRKNGMIPIAKR